MLSESSITERNRLRQWFMKITIDYFKLTKIKKQKYISSMDEFYKKI